MNVAFIMPRKFNWTRKTAEFNQGLFKRLNLKKKCAEAIKILMVENLYYLSLILSLDAFSFSSKNCITIRKKTLRDYIL